MEIEKIIIIVLVFIAVLLLSKFLDQAFIKRLQQKRNRKNDKQK